MDSTPKFCTECGAPLEEGARFCGECGATVTDLQSNDQSKFKQDEQRPKKREIDERDFSRSEKTYPPPPPPLKSEKKIRQDNNKPQDEDSTSGSKNGLLILLVLFFLILAGGIAYMYLGQQSTSIADTIRKSIGLSVTTFKDGGRAEEKESLQKQMLKEESRKKQADNYQMKQELDKFLEDFYSAGTSNNISKALAFYSYPVKTYFNKKNLGKTAIYKDKARYYKKWPVRSYKLEDYKILSDEFRNGIRYFTVATDITWQVQSNKKTLNGTSSNLLKIKVSNGRFFVYSVSESIKKKNNVSTDGHNGYIIKDNFSLEDKYNGLNGQIILLIDRKLPSHSRNYEIEPEKFKKTILKIIDSSGNTIKSVKLKYPIASLEIKKFNNNIFYILNIDQSCEMGSYCGVQTLLFQIKNSKFSWQTYRNNITKKSEQIRLYSALKSTWKMLTTGNKLVVRQVRCGYDFQKNDGSFIVDYITYVFQNNKWSGYKKSVSGFWEDDQEFPGASNFEL